MTQNARHRRLAALVLSGALSLTSCGPGPGPEPAPEAGADAEAEPGTNAEVETPNRAFDPGTREDRAALFDDLVEKTMARDAFASLIEHPYLSHPIDLDVEAEMRRYRDELIEADTAEKLYYALVKISHVRKDRHLRIGLVDGGLTLPDPTGLEESLSNSPVDGTNVPHAPIRFAVDYGTPEEYFLFVADHATTIGEHTGGLLPEVGDRVVAVGDRAIADYIDAVEPYHRYSTTNGFWWQLATWLPQRSVQFPPELYEPEARYLLERQNGEQYPLTLPYLPPDTIEWEGHGERRYPGFSQAFSTSTYDLYLPDDDRDALVLAWHGFRPELPDDMDRLMAYAVEHELLDHLVIWDGTRSGGGSRGAYATQRLSPRPFRTTFGNLKISDITEEFVARTVTRHRERAPSARETLDDGSALVEWLEADVMTAVRERQRYTNSVPFKLAHLPKHSDGIIAPAEVHFRGPMVVFLGPAGGSHLDQFASQVVDNGLAHTMGMSTGGYSNTWQWEEVLRFPRTGQPIVSYMWSIGHTLRPNGEILQWNPAEVDEYIPVTRDNYLDYHAMLLDRALERHGLPPGT